MVKQGYEAETANRLAENAYLAVFDNCVAPGGYRGRGMTVIWGQPHLFTWQGGTLHHHMPCAGCRDEAPGTIDTASVSDTA